jgi:putative transcriptional regulator
MSAVSFQGQRPVRHHPSNALLLAYAAGAADPAMMLLLATHLSFCGRCRGLAARAENVGAARLEDIAPVALAPDALDKVLARLGERDERMVSNDNTPPPLREFLGRDLSQMRWRQMGPKLAYVPLYRRGDVAMRLLRGAPGTDVGRHSHRGMEYTQVLAGGFTDATGQYGPGDFQTATPDVTHNPRADDDGDCVNLAVTTGSLTFDSWIASIAGKFFGF